MKRTLAAVAAIPLALVALAAPASAAKPQVTRTADSGSYAAASTELEMAKFFVNPVATRSGTHLTLWYGKADGAGGSVETMVQADHGFTFTIDRARLGSATLVGTGLPATTCTWHEDTELGCVSSSVDVSLTWKGEGAIARGGSTSHEKRAGFMMVTHGSGTSRNATVSGSVHVGGTSISTFDYAELGTFRNFQMVHCTGAACPPPEALRVR